VYYDLIKEETWEFLKEFKDPTINFKLLRKATIEVVKRTEKDLF
jgi:hypothetical protein